VAGSYFGDLKMPGALPVIVSAFVLLGAAVVASMLPAARAARVDVIQALRSEWFFLRAQVSRKPAKAHQ
jgi:putative ABC transport system permease protein